MAKVMAGTRRSKRRSFDARVRSALIDGLRSAGITAKVQIESIPRTRLHRVTVLSDEFAHLRPMERQDLVWRIMNQQFSSEEQLQISMILTLSPDEARGA